MAVLGVFALGLPSVAAAAPSVQFADWTAVSNNVATGTLLGHTVTFSGTTVDDPPGSTIDGTSNLLSESMFTPPIRLGDHLSFRVFAPSTSYTLDFGAATTDPVIDLGSDGSTLTFPAGTSITRISGDPGLTVAGNVVSGAGNTTVDPVGLNDSNGTIQLNGTFQSISFSATTAYPLDGVYLQVGAPPPPPPITTTTPNTPTPSPPAPVASFATTGRVAPLRLAILNAGSTIGASKLLWDLNGDGHTDVTCGASTPILGLRTLSSGILSVRLTALSSAGAMSSSTQQLSVSGPRLPASLLAKTPAVAICGSSEQAVTGRIGPPLGSTLLSKRVPCLLPSTVTFGVVEAKGCFDHVLSREGVPAPEAPVVTQYYNEAKLPQFAQIVCAKDPTGKACTDLLTKYTALDLFVSHQRVMINGLEFEPQGQGSIVVFPGLQRVVSSNAEVKLGSILVHSGSVDFDLTNRIKSLSGVSIGRAPLLDFDASRDLPSIAGFSLDGQVHLDLVENQSHRYTEAKLHLALPPVFDAFGGNPPNGVVSAIADNTTSGLVFDKLHLAVPSADLGGLRFSDVAFDYSASGNGGDCPANSWKATAKVFLGSTGNDAGFILAPPPSQNGIEFCEGAFKSAGGAILFGDEIPPPELGPGVELNELDFAIGLHPTLIRGGAQITVFRLADVTGTVLIGFPTTTTKYVLSPVDAKSPSHPDVGDLAPLAGRELDGPFIAAGGSVGVEVPILGRIPFGSAYFLFEPPYYIELGGHARISVPGMSVDGGIDGAMSFKTGRFSLHGDLQACIADLPFACVGFEGWVTSNGIVVCAGNIRNGGLHPGAGYHWGDTWPTVWFPDGCKPSHYWVTVQGAAARAASAPAFTVVRGETAKTVRLKGIDGAPNIEVRGPDGETVSSATGTFVTDRKLGILRQNEGRVTWIGIDHGKPGRYTITLLPGSPRVASIASTHPGSREITASVTGTGHERTLRYTVGSPVGERVTLFERTRDTFALIGTARGAKGAIRFRPTAGPGGLREIVAQIQVDGVAAPDRVVGHYRAPAPPTTGTPRGLRVIRHGTTLRISWRPVPGAGMYGIAINQRTAGERLIQLPSRRHNLRITRIARSQSGTVAVSAGGPLLNFGRPRYERFSATEKPFTVLRPFNLLGKPAPKRASRR